MGSRREPYTIRIKRAQSTGVGVRESELTPGGRTPSSLAAAQELETALRAAIRRLPPDYHRVITLYKIKERPLGEVAALMHRTKGATCRLIARAVEQLRMTMVNDEHVESL
jgi:RNA polymerase sigma factor (sigma-70 family)